MIKNYFKITFRNLVKNKWFSIINILGLTLGITASLIIFIYVNQELSFDKFHNDADRIFRVVQTKKNSSGISYESAVPYPMIDALHADFTQFESATLLHNEGENTIHVEKDRYWEDDIIFADSNFFKVFSFKVLEGNPSRSLGQPNKAFLSESIATKYFGESDPIGRKIKLDNSIDLEVAGVVQDAPVHSDINYSIIVSYPTFSSEFFGFSVKEWQMSAEGYAHVKLKEGVNPADLTNNFVNITIKYYSEDEAQRRSFSLQPLTSIHFDQQFDGIKPTTNMTSLWSLGIIGLFIVLVGCVNFINLSTAMAVKKSKEVGVRKTLGAGKFQLIKQFMSDTLIVSTVSGLLALGITERLIPVFNQQFDKNIQIDLFNNYWILFFTLGVVLIVSLISGLYPALVLSNYNPVKALKNNVHSQNNGSFFLRKGLITIQFFISQVLIIATIIIAYQMDYFMDKPLGFSKESVINLELPRNDPQKLESLKNQLLTNSNITNVSYSIGPPTTNNTITTNYGLAEKTGNDDFRTQIKVVDYDYMQTYDLRVIHGRWFDPSEEKAALKAMQDKKYEGFSYVLNETAAKTLGFSNLEDAIGHEVVTGVGRIKAPVVGILADFHVSSLHEEIAPVILMHFPNLYYDIGIKLNTVDIKSTLSHVEEAWNNVFPEYLFNYEFLDDMVGSFYEEEQRTYALFKIFSGISIFISCLGLLGMISFIVNQKTKEIGIRKVLGAKVESIVLLFSKEFLILVIVAFVVATPVAWYIMDLWLSDFAYKIDIKVGYFLLAVVISIVITLLTIGYQSFKAALSNPVDALRDE